MKMANFLYQPARPGRGNKQYDYFLAFRASSGRRGQKRTLKGSGTDREGTHYVSGFKVLQL